MPLWVFYLLAATHLSGANIEYFKVGRDVIDSRLELVDRHNATRFIRLKELFQRAGCPAGLEEQKVKGSKQPNLICRISGATPSTIYVGAHFDATRGEGASDNWSGASLLPSLVTSLSTKPRKHSFVFIGFAAEELGLVGSKAHANSLTQEQLASIRAVVNLDSLGLAPTKVWANRADPQLIQLLLSVAGSMKLPISAVNVEKVGSTDSEPFRLLNVPVITLHSITQETWKIINSPKDTLAVINREAFYDSYQLAAVYLAYLDAMLP